MNIYLPYTNNYNIPRKIRELQFRAESPLDPIIITYQEKLGNYNSANSLFAARTIITYQEKLGNYNELMALNLWQPIITYQEKLGNYNITAVFLKSLKL